jgi:hypothetical protein
MMAYFFVKIARMYFYGFIFIYFITKNGFVDFGSNLKVVLVRKRGERIVIVGTS